MKDREKSNQVILRTAAGDEMFRVTKNGGVATVWRCRANGVWREMKAMPLHEFEEWAVKVRLLGAPDGGHTLLSSLVEKVGEKVNNS